MDNMIGIEMNKSYLPCNIPSNPQIFKGYLDDKREIGISLLRRLAKDLGFSYELYLTLADINDESASKLVSSMCNKSKRTDIYFLMDNNDQILDYSLEYPRSPVLNSDFFKIVSSLFETCDSLHVYETHYHKDDTISTILIKRDSPLIVTENIKGITIDYPYEVGILLINDELNTIYSRLVVFLDDQPYYLPASYYNATNSRYRRSTRDSEEALEVLTLKVIEDLRDEELNNKIIDFHYRYRVNKDIVVSYEEYNTVLLTLMKVPTIIDNNSFLESISSKYEDFEKRYMNLDDQKSSYIWRCTAISDTTIGNLVTLTSHLLKEVCAPSIEYLAIRELLGSYISTSRIATEIAKEGK